MGEGGELVCGPDDLTPFTGWARAFGEEGELLMLGHFLEGRRDGPLHACRTNGQKLSESQYKQGKAHGLFTEWAGSGRKAWGGRYEEGKMTGLWNFLVRDGSGIV